MLSNKIKRPGARHPVLESYGTIHPVDVVCPDCGQVVFHGSKKNDSADATLPKSIYACQCNYFSSSQLVLPLRVEEWAREVKRSITQGGSAGDAQAGLSLELNRKDSQLNLLFADEANKVRTIHRELTGMGKTMLERMVEAGKILTRVKQGLPHGAWMPWVQMHIAELSHRTINRYMRTYSRRSDPLLQDDPVHFIAEISGNVGKLESSELSDPAVSINSELLTNSTSTFQFEHRSRDF